MTFLPLPPLPLFNYPLPPIVLFYPSGHLTFQILMFPPPPPTKPFFPDAQPNLSSPYTTLSSSPPPFSPLGFFPFFVQVWVTFRVAWPCSRVYSFALFPCSPRVISPTPYVTCPPTPTRKLINPWLLQFPFSIAFFFLFALSSSSQPFPVRHQNTHCVSS